MGSRLKKNFLEGSHMGGDVLVQKKISRFEISTGWHLCNR